MTLARLRQDETALALALVDVRARIASASEPDPRPPVDPGIPRLQIAVMEALYQRQVATLRQIAAEVGQRRDAVAAALLALRKRGLVRYASRPSRRHEESYAISGTHLHPPAPTLHPPVETRRGVTLPAMTEVA